jgi:hypothetical protein
VTDAPKFEDLECEQIDTAEMRLRHRKETYLRTTGWQYTSDTIGSYWMWFKDATTPEYKHGKVVGQKTRSYGCSADDAFRIQSTLDRNEYARLHPEEFDD